MTKVHFCRKKPNDLHLQSALRLLTLSRSKSTAAKLDDAIPQRQGRVVHVIAPNIQASSELNPSDDRKIASKKTIVGLLTTMTRGDGTPIYLLTAAKKSLPQFLTPPFFKPPEGDDGMYRAAYVYGSWKEDHNWPPCTNVQFIGRSSNVEDETMALLAEHGVDPRMVTKNIAQEV